MEAKEKEPLDFQSEDTLPLRGRHSEPYDEEEKNRKYEGKSYRKSRVAFALYIILTLVIGVVFVIAGIVVLVAHHLSLRRLEFVVNFSFLRIIAIIFIVLGVLKIIVSIVGLIGTIKFGKITLNAYAIGIAFVSFVLLVGGAILIIMRGKVASGSFNQSTFKNAIITQYKFDLDVNPENEFVTNVVDSIQENYQCCGAYGNVSSEFSWAIYKLYSVWYTKGEFKFPMVPETCCVRGGNMENCQGKHGSDGPPIYGPSKDCEDPHRLINDDLHTIGCVDALTSSTEFYVLISGLRRWFYRSFY
ncbi:hypothetical protein FSP39_018647 [Pinctada imbricata]|uniref:Tetraspanin n=1 Tax=Pinctada imbricata TaxID=66713 RepID=A0AA89C5N1_PINIB|nr:hypothetical protein FSP39_018647 [Pinctada imbricata]